MIHTHKRPPFLPSDTSIRQSCLRDAFPQKKIPGGPLTPTHIPNLTSNFKTTARRARQKIGAICGLVFLLSFLANKSPAPIAVNRKLTVNAILNFGPSKSHTHTHTRVCSKPRERDSGALITKNPFWRFVRKVMPKKHVPPPGIRLQRGQVYLPTGA